MPVAISAPEKPAEKEVTTKISSESNVVKLLESVLLNKSNQSAAPLMSPPSLNSIFNKNGNLSMGTQPPDFFSCMMNFQMDAFSTYMKSLAYKNIFNNMMMTWAAVANQKPMDGQKMEE